MGFARGFSEIVLVVADVEASARFYRDVVGLAPETQSEGWAWFWVGEPDEPQRLAVTRGPLGFEEHSPHPEGERWGPVHFALEVPQERLEEAAAHVRARAVEVHGPVRLGWMAATAYYFYDPDGNLVELWSPDRPSG